MSSTFLIKYQIRPYIDIANKICNALKFRKVMTGLSISYPEMR